MDDARTHDALRELAAMFLTDGSIDPPQTTDPPEATEPPAAAMTDIGQASGPASAKALRIERLLVGHLPGLANLWINQYAQRIGRQAGVPVAVWRIEQQAVELDILNAGDNGHSFPAMLDATLRQVIAMLTDRGALSMVHQTESPPARLGMMTEQLQSWTLLTGADEAAVVAAYRMLKQQLDQRDPTLADDPPTVRMMFLGVDDDAAMPAGRQLQRTAERYLSLRIDVMGAAQKMGPVRRMHVGRFVLDDANITQLIDHFESCDPTAHTPADASVISSSANAQAPPALHLTGDFDDAPTLEPEETAALLEPDTEGEPFDEPLEAEPAPAMVDPREPASTTPGRLSQFVADLRPLEARCPRHEAIELAIDGEGRLHLLMRDAGDHDRAVRDLAEVQQWAIEHLQLLRLTCEAIDSTATAPTAHLFTSDPRGCLTLATAGLVQLHLLQSVAVGDQTHWAHTELS